MSEEKPVEQKPEDQATEEQKQEEVPEVKPEEPKPKTVLFAVSNGTETVEFGAPFDILKRGGAEITIAKVIDPTNPELSLTVKTAQGLSFQADTLITQVTDKVYDMIVLPGGLPNAEYLGKCKELIDMLKKQKNEGRWYCAICASPALAFEPNGILEGEAGTCYPSMQPQLKNQERVKERVVVSNKCITSQGPCTAVDFGYVLCENLLGKEVADKLKEAMLYNLP